VAREFGRQSITRSRIDKQLSGRGSGRDDSGRLWSSRSHTVDLTCLWAVLGNMADLATSVAGLAALIVDGAAVRSGAIARDVSEFTARVTLHGLSLAVASEVIRSSAFVARSGASIATAEATANSTTAAATCKASARRTTARAVALRTGLAKAVEKRYRSRTHSEVTKLTASVAA